MNTAKILIRSPRDLYKIDSHYAFHSYLVNQALTRYQNLIGKDDLGSALGICCTEVEATHFAKYPFSKIVLTDIHEASDKVKEALAKNKKMSYGIENAESLSYPDGSFDLVFCKEGLHHLARPMLGLYEMLRVCRKAVIIVEPYETWLGNILEKFNLTSVYEKKLKRPNIGSRNNYVFRFNHKMLRSILNSYYLNSNYHLEIYLGWLTSKLFGHPSSLVRFITCSASIVAGLIPGSHGNYMTAIIQPGGNIPPKVTQFANGQ